MQTSAAFRRGSRWLYTLSQLDLHGTMQAVNPVNARKGSCPTTTIDVYTASRKLLYFNLTERGCDSSTSTPHIWVTNHPDEANYNFLLWLRLLQNTTLKGNELIIELVPVPLSAAYRARFYSFAGTYLYFWGINLRLDILFMKGHSLQMCVWWWVTMFDIRSIQEWIPLAFSFIQLQFLQKTSMIGYCIRYPFSTPFSPVLSSLKPGLYFCATRCVHSEALTLKVQVTWTPALIYDVIFDWFKW